MEENPDNKSLESKIITERLKAAYILNSIAFGFDINNPPKMDKTVFSMGKLNSEESWKTSFLKTQD